MPARRKRKGFIVHTRRNVELWADGGIEALHLKCVDADGALLGVVMAKQHWNLCHLFVAPARPGPGARPRLMDGGHHRLPRAPGAALRAAELRAQRGRLLRAPGLRARSRRAGGVRWPCNSSSHCEAMTLNASCRLASLDDLGHRLRSLAEDLAAIHHAAWPEVFAPASGGDRDAPHWRESIAGRAAAAFLAHLDGEPVGFVTVGSGDESHSLLQPTRWARVNSICVLERVRGQGVGRR